MATNSNPYVGKDKTPAGMMPADMQARHGLLGVALEADVTYRKHYSRGNRKVKAIFESVKHYRQHVHNVQTPHLASSLRLGVHYLIEPMSRGNSSWQPATQVSVEGASPQAVLKV